MQEFVVTRKEAGGRFDKYLRKLLPLVSSGFLYKMLRKKNITLNDKKAEGKELLAEKDVVKLFFSEETFLKFSGKALRADIAGEKMKDSELKLDENREKENTVQESGRSKSKIYIYQNPNRDYERAFLKLGEISVVYEDEDILILNKPAGVLSQKAEKGDISVNEWMIGYLLDKGEMTQEELLRFRPSICNRLDRNTGGLLLCGKTLRGSQFLARILRDRSLHKYYLAYVQGKIEKSAPLNGYLKKDVERNRSEIISEKEYQRRISTEEIIEESGQKTQIGEKKYQKIETVITPVFYCAEKNWTKLEILLVTGKSHQIRAHLSAIGHPVLGDIKYGWKQGKNGLPEEMELKHQLLHAYKIEFPELDGEFGYLSGKTVTAPLPKQFERLEESFFRKQKV